MNKSILVIDDSANIRKIVKLTFEGIYEVLSAESGEKALELTKTATPDLILVDANMPGISGYEVCRTLKQDKRFRFIPIILMIGTFDTYDEEQGKSAKYDLIISKPFESEFIIKTVTEEIDKAEKRMGLQTPIDESVDEDFIEDEKEEQLEWDEGDNKDEEFFLDESAPEGTAEPLTTDDLDDLDQGFVPDQPAMPAQDETLPSPDFETDDQTTPEFDKLKDADDAFLDAEEAPAETAVETADSTGISEQDADDFLAEEKEPATVSKQTVLINRDDIVPADLKQPEEEVWEEAGDRKDSSKDEWQEAKQQDDMFEGGQQAEAAEEIPGTPSTPAESNAEKDDNFRETSEAEPEEPVEAEPDFSDDDEFLSAQPAEDLSELEDAPSDAPADEPPPHVAEREEIEDLLEEPILTQSKENSAAEEAGLETDEQPLSEVEADVAEESGLSTPSEESESLDEPESYDESDPLASFEDETPRKEVSAEPIAETEQQLDEIAETADEDLSDSDPSPEEATQEDYEPIADPSTLLGHDEIPIAPLEAVAVGEAKEAGFAEAETEDEDTGEEEEEESVTEEIEEESEEPVMEPEESEAPLETAEAEAVKQEPEEEGAAFEELESDAAMDVADTESAPLTNHDVSEGEMVETSPDEDAGFEEKTADLPPQASDSPGQEESGEQEMDEPAETIGEDVEEIAHTDEQTLEPEVSEAISEANQNILSEGLAPLVEIGETENAPEKETLVEFSDEDIEKLASMLIEKQGDQIATALADKLYSRVIEKFVGLISQEFHRILTEKK